MGKRTEKSNGSFMKKMLKMAIIQLSIYTIWQATVFTITGMEASTLTQWFFTFWGIEIAALMVKKILDNRKAKKEEQEDDCLDEESC